MITVRNRLERVVRFVSQVWSELRRVVWPTRRQTVVFTGVVVVSVALVATMIWVADAILSQLLGLVFGLGS